MNKETRRCEWCGDIAQGPCGCPAEIEIERLRDIVKKGRAAYSGYGLLATPPGFAMYSGGGNALLTEWLQATDDYLRGLKA